ncbi:MAG: acyl-CoA synthetase (AMP-forming)/AMP-acid ligase [Actinomycetia bacterium]|nr:acyl-CoA synthetase (AMP-forming)/AMP-acid ligase [Actinomycetes bacterium]
MTDQLPPTIPGLVARAAASFPELEALVDERERLTFAQLDEQVAHAGRALVASGVERGDRVAIWAPNCTEWVITALAIFAAGGVLVPLNTRFKGAEARYVLERADVKLLFTVTDFLDTNYEALLRAEPELPELREIIDLRGTAWPAFLARATAGDKLPDALRGDDLCAILFTSGTTGRPKGAMLTHGATVRAYDAWSTVVGLRAGDRYLVVNPFFHSFGLNAGIVASLVKGAAIVPHAVFDVDAVMARAAEEHVSMLPGPPTVYQSILDHPRLSEFDMSSLRLAVTGAAAVPVELVRRMRAELGFETIVTGYGLTEATGIATMCRHDDDPETIATTSGRAIPDVEVLVVDDKNLEVPRGQAGEVVIRGYNVMRGFIHDPEATAEAIDADGWLHTGDVAVMDERGYIRITDRTKDMFIVGGFNAYPAEIENMINEHPAVGQVAVVGVPDERMGEVGYAYVIPRLNASITPDELKTWCREKMANYKVPRHFEIVEAVPLNASGKVLKYELRERARATLG